jgi:hypothetical protein
VNRLRAGLSIALWLVGISASGLAQNPQQSNDAERLRVELAERARQEAEQATWETKIFQIRYVDPGELQRALSMFRSSINYAGGGLRVLSIRAPKEIMPAIEDAIKRLDVPAPRRDAELTIFVVVASDQADLGTSLPSALQPVMNQLKGVLSYKAYQLVDTLITRTSDTRSLVTLNGTVMLGAQLAAYNFQARFRTESPDGKAPILRLSEMGFRLQPIPGLPGPPGPEVRIAADVDVPQGQQVVVGKATMGDRALILVMTSKISN